jgi:hypothetical protein
MSRVLRYPASATSIAALVLLTAVFWSTGTLLPQELPAYATSSRQITGMALMLIFLPAYILAAFFVTSRRSLELVDQLRPQLPEPHHADAASAAIRSALKTSWRAGVVAGLAMGLANTQPIYALTESPTPGIDVSISFGQLFLWSLVGLVLGTRMQSARAFSRLGSVVDFDLFHLDRLKPLARSGMIDVVMIAAGLAMTPLQALDAGFRWYNYSFGLIVLVPAAVLLLLWPLWSIHRRIRFKKHQQLVHVDALIRDTPGAATREAILGLETLLAHRDRLREQRTWPLSTALVSRLVLYLIIPPVAWVGAALVETFVSRIIGS